MIKQLLAILLFSSSLWAQSPASPLVMPRKQFLDQAARPLAYGHVCTYTVGTTTPQITYTDYTASTPNALCDPIPDPSIGIGGILLDAGGYASIYMKCSDPAYRIVLYDLHGVFQWLEDGVQYPECGGGGGVQPTGLYVPNSRRFIEFVVDANGGFIPAPIIGHRGLSTGICAGGVLSATSTRPICCALDNGWPGQIGRETSWGFTNPGKRSDAIFHLALENTTLTQTVDFGLYDTGPTGTTACTGGTGGINGGAGIHPDCTVAQFYFQPSSGPNWWAYIKDTAGGTSHGADTGIAADTNFHKFRIADRTSTFNFYIDGALVALFGSNLPSPSSVWGLEIGGSSGFAESHAIYWTQITVTFDW
jgi:hypothetical protein